MEFLTSAQGTNRTLQTVRWLCEPITLLIGHFESPTAKSNWTVGEKLIVYHQEAVTEWRLIFVKESERFFNALFQNLFISKKKSVMEFLANTGGTQGTLQSVNGLVNRSFCRSDIPRVQLKSNVTVGGTLLGSCSKTVWKSRLSLSKARLIIFNGWFGNCIISNVMLHSGNCSDIQVAFRTHYFVDRTFQESNWSPTEQLVKGW